MTKLIEIGEGGSLSDAQPGDVVVFGGNHIGPDNDPDTRLIVVTQLPVIKERLKVISEKIKQDTEKVLAMDVTEETVKQAKVIRAEMNKAFTQLEDERMRVKNEIAAPYVALETTYKELISNPFKKADTALKRKISSVETGLKDAKVSELTDYFNEYALSQNVDFVNFSDAKINVTLTASMKGLRELCKEFIDKKSEERDAIGALPNSDEIMAEYLVDFNMARACKDVKERYEAIEKAKKERESRETAEAQRATQAERERREQERQAREESAAKVGQTVSAVDTSRMMSPVIAPPVETPSVSASFSGFSDGKWYTNGAELVEKTVRSVFEVTATIPQIRELKAWMTERGIQFRGVKEGDAL